MSKNKKAGKKRIRPRSKNNPRLDWLLAIRSIQSRHPTFPDSLPFGNEEN